MKVQAANNALNCRSLRSLDVQKLRFWPPVSLIVRRKGNIGYSAPSQVTQSPHQRSVPESNGRLTVEAVICGQQRSCFQRMCTSQITSGAKTDTPCAPSVKRSAGLTCSVRLGNLTIGSSRSLRSLGTGEAGPLAKRYVSGEFSGSLANSN